eukprot:5731246-Pyramimonas_sp.AAC.1
MDDNAMRPGERQNVLGTLCAHRKPGRTKGPTFSIQTIADPPGAPIFDPDAGARELARRWGAVRSAVDIDASAVEELLGQAPQ